VGFLFRRSDSWRRFVFPLSPLDPAPACGTVGAAGSDRACGVVKNGGRLQYSVVIPIPL